MASSDNEAETGLRVTAADIARLRNGSKVSGSRLNRQGGIAHTVSMKQSTKVMRANQDAITKKAVICLLALAALVYLSLGIMGAQGASYPYAGSYATYTPVQVAQVLGEYVYNTVGQLTGAYAPHTNEWILQNVPGYWGVAHRAGVIGITLVCAVLLSVSGMLYQNAFKNPIAGPSMLGVSSGVSLGMMILVYVFGNSATSMLTLRYGLCYGCGAAVLLFVMLAGYKLSGRGKPFDLVTMLLIGSIVSQLLGFITSYITLFVMDTAAYDTFYTLEQMLTVDTSLTSWVTLGVVSAVSLLPVVLNRYKFTALALDDEDARALGVNLSRLRAISLFCGALMILAAQVHVGMVSLISLIVPFLARRLFGSEFNKQLIGSVCIGTLLLLACRDITDLIPFVGDGIAVGSVVAVAALPLIIVIMAKQTREWGEDK